MPGVFLSYRRSDSGPFCGRLADHLALRFGDDVVFRDVDDLRPGMRWRGTIDEALSEADVVLVIIGPSWASADLLRRLERPDDVLRHEIATAALRDEAGKVVPLLVGGASMPDPSLLPEALRPLCEWQAFSLRDESWREDIERLVRRLREIVPTLDPGSLHQVQAEVHQEQLTFFDALQVEPARALTLARATLGKLDRACPRHPTDAWLQLARGFTHKNLALALRTLGRSTEASATLDQAARTFSAALAERPLDPDAWNGLGSVEATRGNVEQALAHVRRALEIAPDHEVARRDERALMEAMTAR